jgi:hypothetical protein
VLERAKTVRALDRSATAIGTKHLKTEKTSEFAEKRVCRSKSKK